MSRMLLSPGRYVQGAGAIKEIGLHTSSIGTCALVIGGKTALSLCGPDILASLAEQDIPCHQEFFRGVSSQLVLEGRPKSSIKEVQDFCISVGLPLCLEDLDIIDPSADDIRQVAEATVAVGETIHSTWFDVTADMVETAIRTADALGINYKKANR